MLTRTASIACPWPECRTSSRSSSTSTDESASPRGGHRPPTFSRSRYPGSTTPSQTKPYQALGIRSGRKYQSEGGPTLADCFDLIRAATAVPARDAGGLLEYVALSFLVANHDAHGKNYSLLYTPQGSKGVLAPAYDVLSTFVYSKVQPMSRKMAMSIGTEYRPEYVRPRHLNALFEGAHLGAAAARRRLRSIAEGTGPALDAVHADFAARGWDASVLGRISDLAERRAKLLADLTVAKTRAPR